MLDQDTTASAPEQGHAEPAAVVSEEAQPTTEAVAETAASPVIEDVDAPPAEPVLDPNELIMVKRGEWDQVQTALKSLTRIVDGVAKRIVELSGSNNKIIDFINGMHEDQRLIDNVAASVVGILESSNDRIDDAVALQIAKSNIVLHETMPPEESRSDNLYKIHYDIVGEVAENGGHTGSLYVHQYDPNFGSFTILDPKELDDKQQLMMKVFMSYININNIDAGKEILLEYKPTPMTSAAAEEPLSEDESMLAAQAKIGQIRNNVQVAREYFEGSSKFTFREASEEDEAPFSFELFDRLNIAADHADLSAVDHLDAVGAWGRVGCDTHLGMHYTGLINAQGGKPGEMWYIAHA